MKILLVEDNPRHQEEARTVLASVGAELSFVAGDELFAWFNMVNPDGTPAFDGVLLDIFIPHMREAPYNSANEPCGLAIALLAERLGIPFVFCTDGYHHGERSQWIHHLCQKFGWPNMVDNWNQTEGATFKSKKWLEAWEILRDRIVNKKGPSDGTWLVDRP